MRWRKSYTGSPTGHPMRQRLPRLDKLQRSLTWLERRPLSYGLCEVRLTVFDLTRLTDEQLAQICDVVDAEYPGCFPETPTPEEPRPNAVVESSSPSEEPSPRPRPAPMAYSPFD